MLWHAVVSAAVAYRAFYEAGMAWRAANRPSMAFVILNRLLDMADAQEDPQGVHSLAQLENADFANTGKSDKGVSCEGVWMVHQVNVF